MFGICAGLVSGLGLVLMYMAYGLIFVAGAWLVSVQGLTPRDVFLATTMLVYCMYGAATANDHLSSLLSALSAIQSLGDSIDKEPLIERRQAKGIRPEIKGVIEFRDVSFSYPGRKKKTLEGLSFRTGPGGSAAFFGMSAAGKSTVVELLLRFYEP